jgi:hypothetical protein
MKRTQKSILDAPMRLTWPNGHSEVFQTRAQRLEALDKHGREEVRYEVARDRSGDAPR